MIRNRCSRTAALLLALCSVIANAGTSHELTQADAEAWLDGYIPYALTRGDIAGAVVVIVKDGRVVTQRGYGYADRAARQKVDPANTLFRPGSTSKLFTWTAVMQLVEQGKIDLDADVNRYLDFSIPPFEDKPITMRNIMTHTPGFEQSLKHLIVFQGPAPPLGETLKDRLPRRVFAPGSTPAYSNYATGLAGYIVERVSGLDYPDYIERYIFQPLGMTHSTFRQPLPASLEAFMSQGYSKASGEAEPYEFVTLAPAGAGAISGSDMAKFMIAQLSQGAGLMQPATAQLMHDPTHVNIPGTNRMALGFYEQRDDGVEAIAHAGDAINFHSDLWLFPREHVGMFVSMNSAGVGAATHDIRRALFYQFSDRYFSSNAKQPPRPVSTAQEHAKLLSGSYLSSVGSFTNFIDFGNFLTQVRIDVDKNGEPFTAALPNLAGQPRHWIEIAPFLWQDEEGPEHLAAKVVDGAVVRFAVDDDSPFTAYLRVPWYRNSVWLMPLFILSIGVVMIAALSWPVAALVRHHYGVPHALRGQRLITYRALRILAWAVMVVLIVWISMLNLRTVVMGEIDRRVWLLQVLGTLGYVGLFGFALWNLRNTLKDTRRASTLIASICLVISASTVLWVALAFHLISFGTRF
jgi:CubicO group peptidase (beta-lactamase class C family)